MQKTLNILNVLVKIALLGLLTASTFLVIQLKNTVDTTQRTMSELTTTVKQSQELVSQVQHKLNDDGGVLDILKKTMLHVDRVAGEAAMTSVHERTYWDDTNHKVLAILDNANAAIVGLNKTQAQVGVDVHDSMGKLNAVLEALPPLLQQGQTDLASIDVVLRNPDVSNGMHSIAESAANIDSITGSGAAIMHDVQVKVNKSMHPTKTQEVINGLLTAMKASVYLSWAFK